MEHGVRRSWAEPELVPATHVGSSRSELSFRLACKHIFDLLEVAIYLRHIISPEMDLGPTLRLVRRTAMCLNRLDNFQSPLPPSSIEMAARTCVNIMLYSDLSTVEIKSKAVSLTFVTSVAIVILVSTSHQ